MKKRILAIAMSVMTTMMIITGCGSKESNDAKEPTSTPEAVKLDNSVKVEDLLTSDSMNEITDISKFKGSYDLDIVLDLALKAEEEATIKGNIGFDIACDGKVLHTVSTANTDILGAKTDETIEIWYSDETKTQYRKENDTWYKYTDESLEDILSELINVESMPSDLDIDALTKDFKLELDEKNGVYVLKYEAGIKELLEKMPEDLKGEMTEGMDVDAVIESLDLPEDFKVSCVLTFGADKAFRGMSVVLSSAKLDLSSIAGTDLVIDINEVKFTIVEKELEALTIPEDVVKNATEPWNDDVDFEDMEITIE